MVKLFCSQRHNIRLMLLLAASFLRDTCLTLRKTVACPAKSKYKPLVAGLGQQRCSKKIQKLKNKCKKVVASLSPVPWRSRENRRATACWIPSRSVCLRGGWGGRTSVPPASLHPLWDTEEGKINAGGERQEELRGFCRCSERQPNQTRWRRSRSGSPSCLAQSSTLCYSSSMDHWSYGEETKREKDRPLNLSATPPPDNLPHT